MDNKCVWNKYNATQLKELESFTSDYINFISECKTERECVEKIVNDIEKEGYIDINTAIKAGKKLKAGDKVYAVKMNKSIIMMNVGSDKLEDGVNILGAHIDSPRLDVKANPLYEDSGIAYLDTHYYGGIKKYQWVTIPLAIHGVVAKKDGTTTIINLGEEDTDPVFFISDLLIHLSQEQLEKKAAKVIEGEALDIIIGNKPIAKETKKTNAKTVKEAGAKIYNIIPLIPQHELKEYAAPTCPEIDAARIKASQYIDVFRHCQHCRADAVGVPGKSEFGDQIYQRRLNVKETFSHG